MTQWSLPTITFYKKHFQILRWCFQIPTWFTVFWYLPSDLSFQRTQPSYPRPVQNISFSLWKYSKFFIKGFGIEVCVELNKTPPLFQGRKTPSILSVSRKNKCYLTIETLFRNISARRGAFLGDKTKILKNKENQFCVYNKYIKSVLSETTLIC